MNLDEPKFLNLAQVLYLHDESLARFGGSPGVREPGLVESALGSAQNAFWYGHGGIFEIASAYAFHIAESQAFVDGNKRTAITATGVFLLLNGYKLLFNDLEAYDWLIDLYETHRVSKANIEPWLRAHSKAL